jgi:putative ABC transport system substrate-binding protein
MDGMVGENAQDGKEHKRRGEAGRPTPRLSRRDLVLGASRWTASAGSLVLLDACQSVSALAPISPPIRRIGVLSAGAREFEPDQWDAFVDQLRQLGWTEGANLTIEWRFAEGRDELLPQLAADLVGVPVEVIFALTTPCAVAARQQTSTIPIVMAFVTDPVTTGLVSNLGHPGGNVTGMTYAGGSWTGKSAELLKTVLPRLSRLAVLEDQSFLTRASLLSPLAAAAAQLGIQMLDLDVRRVEDVDGAFEAAKAWSAEGLIIISNPNFQAGVSGRVVTLAAQERLPACYLDSLPVTEEGGFMAYCPNHPAEFRLSAEYLDKILRGATPADLPVQDPRQFDFVVNVKSAEALGITFPPDAAVQVTQWVR